MTELNKYDRTWGSVLGNAVGDALGAPAEFKGRDQCKKRWPNGVTLMEISGQTKYRVPGCYTDDTEMGVAMGLGILDAGYFHPASVAQRFGEWYDSHPPDVGCHTSGILRRIGDSYDLALDLAFWSTKGQMSAGNGSVMRQGILLPYVCDLPIFHAMQIAELQSTLTHASREAADSCKYLMFLQMCFLRDVTPEKAFKLVTEFAVDSGWAPKVCSIYKRLQDYKSGDELPTSGYVIDTLDRALWYLLQDVSFHDGLADCVVHGGDADSAGAVCGHMLGTLHGAKEIPKAWVEAVEAAEVAREISLRELHDELLDAGCSFANGSLAGAHAEGDEESDEG